MDERINQRGTGGVYCRRTKESKTYFRQRKRDRKNQEVEKEIMIQEAQSVRELNLERESE